ncbi:hypothetical protein [Aquimarina sp. SS2-1]|uniref:hypothetical protein n=1 Tax=Aquimarina besae TaxID=3342247 RepID=UPI0036719643
MTKIPDKNIEPGGNTPIKTGEGNFLYCDYNDPSIKRCAFHIYRIDGKSVLGNKNEWIIYGSRQKNSYERLMSNDFFAPRFEWFEEEEEEIKVAFDVSFHGSTRISCRDHVLILQKGDFEINLYWDEEKNKKNKNHSVRIFAEFTETAPLSRTEDVPFKLAVKYMKKFANESVEDKGTYQEESRNKKGKLTIVKSEEIKLKDFHESFCAPGILAKLGSHYPKSTKHKIDIQEKKTFKRGYYYEPEEILTFLRDKKLIPKDVFYDGIVTPGEYKNMYDKAKSTVEGLVDFFTDIAKFRKNFATGYLEKFIKWGYEEWRKNNYAHRFYREEYTKALLHLNGFNNEKKKERKRNFDKWFASHYGTVPKGQDYINMKQELQKEKDEYDNKPRDEQYADHPMKGRMLESLLDNLRMLEGKYERELGNFKKLEAKTSSYLEIGGENCPYTMF